MSNNNKQKQKQAKPAEIKTEVFLKFTANQLEDGKMVRSIPIEAKSFEEAQKIAKQRFAGN